MQKGHRVTENKLLVEVWMGRFQFSLRDWPMGIYGQHKWERGHKGGQADLGGLGSECYWGA